MEYVSWWSRSCCPVAGAAFRSWTVIRFWVWSRHIAQAGASRSLANDPRGGSDDLSGRAEDREARREAATAVFERMAVEDVNPFPVMADGRLLGMVARDNVLGFLRRRAELGLSG